jgi:hypothetical protein
LNNSSGGQWFQNPVAQKRWGKHFQSNSGKKDLNTIEVDTIQVNQLSAKEKQCLVQEGWCFCCKNTGHILKQCPTRKTPDQRTGQFMANTQYIMARTSEVVDNWDTKELSKLGDLTLENSTTTFSQHETICADIIPRRTT